MGHRRPEEGDDGVAEQLVDAPAERLDVGDEALEARLDQPLDLLRVEILGERGVPDEVGEENRDHPPFLDGQGGRGDDWYRTTGSSEPPTGPGERT